MKVAVIGAAGYTGGELIRLLVNHPRVSELVCVSESQADRSLASVHADLFELRDKTFVGGVDTCDFAFLAGGHGESQRLIERHKLWKTALVDLSQDFRDGRESFVYGLPEVFAGTIAGASRVANPGCFATAIQLALAPLALKGWLGDAIHVTGITGSTGAGQKLQETSHFSWRSNNLSVYKAFEHQHEEEIQRSLGRMQKTFDAPLLFVPMRGPFARGILCSLYTRVDVEFAAVQAAFDACYEGSPFVFAGTEEVSLKQVVNSNQVAISLAQKGPYIHIVSCLDNLLKGAAGQALQNMNIMLGLPETTGLKLKASAF